jgi:putative heme-binding domain-containing protein
LSEEGLHRAVERLEGVEGDALSRRLAGIELATASRAQVAMPAAWKRVAPKLDSGGSAAVSRQVERLAAVFGDTSMFPRLREVLAAASAEPAARRHAFAILDRASNPGSLPVFLQLLDDGAFRMQAIRSTARFDSPEVSSALLSRFERLSVEERSAALNTLTSRVSFAHSLLDAVDAGHLGRDRLTSFHVRQLLALGDPETDRRVRSTWGTIVPTPAEKAVQMARLAKTFEEAPLWAYDSRAGREHFQKLCMQCHRLGEGGANVGPDLTGAGKHGVRYFIENSVDPNAVVGADYRLTVIVTRKGDLVSGLVVKDSPSSLAVHTVAGEVVVAKTDILRSETTESSLMPEGLLESLSEREQIELLKFLTSL